MIIATDLDGVVANISEEMCRRYGEIGIEAKEQELISFKWEDVYGSPYDGWIGEQLADPTFWLNAKPYQDSWYVINKWIEEDHEVHVVTARWEKEVTERWLKEWDIPYNSLTTGVKTGHKYKAVKKLGATFMVEDRAEEIYALANRDIITFCMDRPWNKEVVDDNHIFTVASFYDIDAMLEKI